MAAQAGSFVLIEKKGPDNAVATLTVRNERKLNVLNSAVVRQINQALEILQNDPSIRAVIVTGGGSKAFIGGADITEMVGLDAESAREFITGIHRVCDGIRALPVPTIARISGYCLGAGLEVAAACDLRATTEEAVFGMPEVRVGVPSVIEAALLPQLVGWGRTRELLLTGRKIDAAEALQWGLVERVVPANELDAAINAWIADILDSSPAAIRTQKELIRQWERLPLAQAIEAGIDAFSDSYRRSGPKQAMSKFIDRKR